MKTLPYSFLTQSNFQNLRYRYLAVLSVGYRYIECAGSIPPQAGGPNRRKSAPEPPHLRARTAAAGPIPPHGYESATGYWTAADSRSRGRRSAGGSKAPHGGTEPPQAWRGAKPPQGLERWCGVPSRLRIASGRSRARPSLEACTIPRGPAAWPLFPSPGP